MKKVGRDELLKSRGFRDEKHLEQFIEECNDETLIADLTEFYSLKESIKDNHDDLEAKELAEKEALEAELKAKEEAEKAEKEEKAHLEAEAKEAKKAKKLKSKK